MKRLLLFIIIFTFIFVSAAYGQEFTDVEGTRYEEAVDFLSAYDIVDGFPDGSFRPEDPVTRGQISKMITIVLGYEDFTINMKSTFADMDGHWAERYVEVAHGFDIVQGYLDGNFGPDNEITYTEVITMIIRSLGYTDRSLPGSWPYDYLVKAGDLGIVNGIPLAGDKATRGDIALMMYSALFSEKGSVKGHEGYWESSEEILLSNIGYGEYKQITKEEIEQAEPYLDLSKYEYYKGTLYYKESGQIVYLKNTDTGEISGEIVSVSNDVVVIEDQYGNRKPFDTEASSVIFNGVPGKVRSLIGSKARIIYSKKDNDDVYAITGNKITKKVFSTSSFDGENIYNGIYLPLKGGSVNEESILIVGDVDSIYDIRPNDLIYTYETDEPGYKKTYLEMKVVRNKVQGAMTKTGRNDAYGYTVINGKRYNHSDIYKPLAKLSPGYYVMAYLDENNEVVKYNIVRDLQQPEDYGLVTDVQKSTQDQLPQISIIDNSGVERDLYIDIENSLLVETGGFDDISYTANLSEGDVIKYNLQSENIINKMKIINMEDYDGTYDSKIKSLIKVNAKVNGSTLIFSKDENKWSKIQLDSLGEFIKGQIALNQDGDYVELLIIESGIITSYPDTIHVVAENISTILNIEEKPVSKLYGYIEGKKGYIYSDPSYTDTAQAIQNHIGQLLELELIRDKVKAFIIPQPELEFSQISNIYGNRILKSEGTFYEYAEDTRVYSAEKKEEGYEITDSMWMDEIESGDYVQLYDLDGDFDGVIDHIIVIKK